MDDQAAVGIDIGCNAGTAVIGHAAAQIDAEGLVTLPIGGKALGLIGVERAVKAEIRQILRQPLGVGGCIDRHTLQGKAGAVGQAGGIEIGLRLGKVQQQVVGPFDLTLHAVAGTQGIADGKAGKERQGGGLHKVHPDDCRVIKPQTRGIGPAAAQTAAPGGLVGRVDRADRAEFVKILLGPEVGAVYLRQIDNAFIHSEGTLFQLNSQWPSLMVMTP